MSVAEGDLCVKGGNVRHAVGSGEIIAKEKNHSLIDHRFSYVRTSRPTGRKYYAKDLANLF
jgi:hypothetical protein